MKGEPNMASQSLPPREEKAQWAKIYTEGGDTSLIFFSVIGKRKLRKKTVFSPLQSERFREKM
jgi:hypothetical protein